MESLQPNPHVILQSMGDRALLLNTETGDCFELNRVGRDVWNALLAGMTVQEVVEIVASRYAAEHSLVVGDVTALLETLSRHGIVMKR